MIEDHLDESEIVNELAVLFPHANRGVINAAMDCLSLHNEKNHDYNGDLNLAGALGITGRFCDVWRKVIRLHTAIIQRKVMMVDEKMQETADDLVVYSLMLSEEIKKQNKGVSHA